MFDYRNAGLYPAAIQAFKTSFTIVIMFAFAALTYEYIISVSGIDAPPVGDMIIEISFAFFIHQTILLGSVLGAKGTSVDRSNFSRFLIRGLAFSIVIALAAIPALLISILLSPSEDYFLLVTIVFFVVISLPLTAIFLSVFGTIFPAVVAGSDISFRAARARSRGQFWSTMVRFLIGPTLMTLIGVGLIVVLAEVLKIPFEMFNEMNGFSIIGAIITFVLNIFGYFVSTLFVTILCKAYLNATPQSDNT